MLILTGRSCSGKDSIAKEMCKKGYKKITTYTTRLMRAGEVNDETYHFISTEDFLVKYIGGFFLEVNYFNTEFGVWFYGSSIESYQQADDRTVCILTPDGLNKVKKHGIKNTSIYIDVSDKVIKNRQEIRGDNSTEKKKEEAKRRFEKDKIDFAGIHKDVDYTLNGDISSPSIIADMIMYMVGERGE